MDILREASLPPLLDPGWYGKESGEFFGMPIYVNKWIPDRVLILVGTDGNVAFIVNLDAERGQAKEARGE